MTNEERKTIRKSAKKILSLAANRKDGIKIVEEILINISVNSMDAEREQWLEAMNVLGPKTKEKLKKARFG